MHHGQCKRSLNVHVSGEQVCACICISRTPVAILYRLLFQRKILNTCVLGVELEGCGHVGDGAAAVVPFPCPRDMLYVQGGLSGHLYHATEICIRWSLVAQYSTSAVPAQQLLYCHCHKHAVKHELRPGKCGADAKQCRGKGRMECWWGEGGSGQETLLGVL